MHCKSYSHFFSKKYQHICVSLDVNFNESLTNDVVSFEQLGPDLNLLNIMWITPLICSYGILTDQRKILNYRLSRNRHNIEQAFSIPGNGFGCLLPIMHQTPKTVETVVLGRCCLLFVRLSRTRRIVYQSTESADRDGCLKNLFSAKSHM